ncbi:MAG: hypothetical protein JF590_07040 [Gemmatimonadetes bacterium]|nr:hypothetical protein [Gemmatimonadota bacterium]
MPNGIGVSPLASILRLLGGGQVVARLDVDHRRLGALRDLGEGVAEVGQALHRGVGGRRADGDDRGVVAGATLRLTAERKVEDPGEEKSQGERRGGEAAQLEPVLVASAHKCVRPSM